jgi:hypothetical protein
MTGDGASSSSTKCSSAALAVVLPHELGHLAGFDRGVDPYRRGGVMIARAVFTHDDPSTIRPLDNRGMMDFSQIQRLLLSDVTAERDHTHGGRRTSRAARRSTSCVTIL